MIVHSFRCVWCKTSFLTQVARCSCGSSVQVVYERIPKISWNTLRTRSFGHWRYAAFLPEAEHLVSLDEGHTPLIGAGKLFFKLEGCNPTGSFKDRGTTVEVSLTGTKGVVCASTGNMGASVAAYCARAKRSCTIVLPQHTPEQKIKQIHRYGAVVKKVRGHYTDAVFFAQNIARSKKMYLAGDYAYRREGEKTVLFEILDQLRDVERIICPMGNGTLISALWQGIVDFRTAGLIKKIPTLIGVQATGCAPIAKAFLQQKPVQPVVPQTIASAVACGDPLDGVLAVQALTQSKGTVMTITDTALIRARRTLAAEYGIDAEPAGVLPFAAWQNMKQHKKTALVITGNGLKDLVHV